MDQKKYKKKYVTLHKIKVSAPKYSDISSVDRYIFDNFM